MKMGSSVRLDSAHAIEQSWILFLQLTYYIALRPSTTADPFYLFGVLNISRVNEGILKQNHFTCCMPAQQRKCVWVCLNLDMFRIG